MRSGGLGTAIERAFGADFDALSEGAAWYSTDPFAYAITESLCQVRDAAIRYWYDADSLRAISEYTTAVLVGLYFNESFASVLRRLESGGTAS